MIFDTFLAGTSNNFNVLKCVKENVFSISKRETTKKPKQPKQLPSTPTLELPDDDELPSTPTLDHQIDKETPDENEVTQGEPFYFA